MSSDKEEQLLIANGSHSQAQGEEREHPCHVQKGHSGSSFDSTDWKGRVGTGGEARPGMTAAQQEGWQVTGEDGWTGGITAWWCDVRAEGEERVKEEARVQAWIRVVRSQTKGTQELQARDVLEVV